MRLRFSLSVTNKTACPFFALKYKKYNLNHIYFAYKNPKNSLPKNPTFNLTFGLNKAMC